MIITYQEAIQFLSKYSTGGNGIIMPAEVGQSLKDYIQRKVRQLDDCRFTNPVYRDDIRHFSIGLAYEMEIQEGLTARGYDFLRGHVDDELGAYCVTPEPIKSGPPIPTDFLLPTAISWVPIENHFPVKGHDLLFGSSVFVERGYYAGRGVFRSSPDGKPFSQVTHWCYISTPPEAK